MTTLEQVIRFWQRIKHDFSFLMQSDTASMVELTIHLLQELETRRKGRQ